MSNAKRKKRLVNRRLQLKMIAVFSIVGVTCSLFQTVLIHFGIADIAQNASGGSGAITDAARGMMLKNLVFTVGALLPLMTCVGLIVTHRVAGPAHHLTQHCLAIAAGGPVKPCQVRTRDNLKDLCEALNAALTRIAPPVEAAEPKAQKWVLEEAQSLVQRGLVEAAPKAKTPDETAEAPEETGAPATTEAAA